MLVVKAFAETPRLREISPEFGLDHQTEVVNLLAKLSDALSGRNHFLTIFDRAEFLPRSVRSCAAANHVYLSIALPRGVCPDGSLSLHRVRSHGCPPALHPPPAARPDTTLKEQEFQKSFTFEVSDPARTHYTIPVALSRVATQAPPTGKK
jgi:hypothetical protein